MALPESVIALDAFTAGFDKEGNVYGRTDLNDPTVTPTIVAKYEADDIGHVIGIYHDRIDAWEVIIRGQKPFLANAGSLHYRYCEGTVASLDGPLNSRHRHDNLADLSRQLCKEITAEIDAETIRSFRNALGSKNSPISQPALTISTSTIVPTPNRKLKAVWTIESQEDLLQHFGKPGDFVCKSEFYLELKAG